MGDSKVLRIRFRKKYLNFSRERNQKRQNGGRITNASSKPDQREKDSQARKRSYKSGTVAPLILSPQLLILERNERKQSSSRSLPPRPLHLRRLRLCYLRDHHESPGFRRTVKN